MTVSSDSMGSRPVFPLLMSMAIPPMISMLIQSMYNIVDSIFVSKLGEDALTAVSLAFPLQNLVLAAGVGFGVGVNAAIARNLGAENHREVNKAASHGVVLTAIHSVLFVLLGLFATEPFFRLFTKDETVLSLGCTYSYIVITLAAGSLFHIFIEKMFQSIGNMLLPMIMQGVGAVINIILDPILIFGYFGFPAMGVAGAAIATIIGQFSACGLSVWLFYKNHGSISISLKGFRFDKQMLKTLYSVGIPSCIMICMPSVMIGILNSILAAVSQTAVAVLGVYFKLQTFVYMPASGLVQGMRPLISYNYGAGNRERVKKILSASLYSTGVIMALGTVLFLIFPEPIMKLFHAGNTMMSMGTAALRIISTGFLVSTVGTILSGAFESLGKGVQSLVITVLRQFIVIVILSLIFIKPFGITGVWITFPIAECLASVVGVILFRQLWCKDPILQKTSETNF